MVDYFELLMRETCKKCNWYCTREPDDWCEFWSMRTESDSTCWKWKAKVED